MPEYEMPVTRIGRDWDEITQLVTVRRNARGQLLEAMMDVRERYNGDWVIPDLGADSAPFTPTIVADAIDHNALRAASVMPDIAAPAFSTTGTARDRARGRRGAWLYTWEKSELNLHLRRAYRHLFGYATTALEVIPDFKHECIKVVVRDPLHAFPEPKAAEDLSPPRDCAYIYGKSPEWLLARYPGAAAAAGVKPKGGGYLAGDELWDVVEWVDENAIVVGILGPRADARSAGWSASHIRPVEIARWENRAGRCTTVIPQRVTLDRVASAVANATGIADMQARLMQLHLVALEKSIVPDTYITGSSSAPPKVVGGWRDGRTGEVNEILDATSIGQLRQEPSQTALAMVDRLERNARVNTGTVPAFQGESFGGARTGRGLDALLAASVDPRIQEAQEIMAARLTDVNHIVGEAYKGYWGAKSYKVYAGWNTDTELTEFNPGSDFAETTENKAFYAIPGTDIVGFNVVLGQLAGIEALSLESFRRLHPYIKDADGEKRRVLVQKLRQAAEMQILARASDPQGGMTPTDMANLIRAVEDGDDLHVAIDKAQAAAQARQAQEAPPPPEGMNAAPETMPGLANPGEGAEMQGPIPEVPAGLSGLDQLLGALSSPVGPRV